MSYLLAKILFLLLLAALLGAWFGYWWVRRQYDDVTSEYSRLKNDWQTWRKGFEEKLSVRPEPDLKPLTARIDDIPAAVRGILFPLQDRLAAVESAIAGIKIPAPQPVDLGALEARLEALERAVGGIRLPASPTLDLAPTQKRLDDLERAINAIVIPAPREVDFQPIYERLAALGSSAAAARDLGPVLQRIDELARQIQPPPPPLPPPSAMVRAGSRNLLAHAAFGTPDDLQLIKGVARVMEGMLHHIGVYYFWQIAEWTPADVAHADAQLTAFRGRIERDHWVRQAKQFAARPQSARRPEGV